MALKLKINRTPRISSIRFTRSEMREIGTAVRDAEVDRIHQGLKPDLSAAKPLSRGYAITKTRKTGGRAIRDWRLKNDLPASLKVTVASPELAIIKFPAETVRKALVRERSDDMFSMSERGEDAGNKLAQNYLEKAVKRAVS